MVKGDEVQTMWLVETGHLHLWCSRMQAFELAMGVAVPAGGGDSCGMIIYIATQT